MSTFKERVAAGECGTNACTNKPDVGRSLCATCAEVSRVRATAKRIKAAANKACPNHPDRKCEEGKSKCADCLACARKSTKKRHARNKAAGDCQNHPGRSPVTGRTLCQECLDDMNVYSAGRYATAKRRGEICLTCRKQPRLEHYSQCANCRETGIVRNRALKLEVLQAYIGKNIVCAWCPCNDTDVLEIDHIDGGGRKHRAAEEIGSGSAFYYWLKRNDFPAGFRVLCPTCNKKAYRTGGIKPNAPLPNNQV